MVDPFMVRKRCVHRQPILGITSGSLWKVSTSNQTKSTIEGAFIRERDQS